MLYVFILRTYDALDSTGTGTIFMATELSETPRRQGLCRDFAIMWVCTTVVIMQLPSLGPRFGHVKFTRLMQPCAATREQG